LKVIEDDEILTLIADPKQLDRGFKYLMVKYQEPLYWHIRRMVKSHEDTDDVLQNTFIKVYKNIKRFESKSKLFTWLYKIATNESITFLNKRKKKRTESIDEQSSLNNMATSDSVDGDELMLKLNRAISILPTKQKLVFNMRYYDEMTYDQISAVLGTSVGGLKASYHHAVKKIESFIKEE